MTGTIHRLIADQAGTQPDAPALVDGELSLNYRTVHLAAARLATELWRAGVRPGDVVPMIAHRSARLVVTQLAVLQCGAAYAGLDPRWPAERQRTILALLAASLLVREDTAAELDWSGPTADLADLTRSALDPAGTPDPGVGGELAAAGSVPDTAAATVFFTSGTTGVPKLVLTPHRAVTRLFGPTGLAGFGTGHATPQAAPLPWDMYGFETWGQLVSGGTVHLVPEDHLLPSSLRRLVKAGVDTLWLTTSLFNLFVDEDAGSFAGLGQVLTGGEKLSPDHVRRFVVAHRGIPLHNGYGPAENCMLTTTRRIQPGDWDVAGGIPVGVEVPGTQIYLLDPDHAEVAAGQAGEIAIAGTGLAIGYLGDSGYTADQFVTVEVSDGPQRVYLTGDLGLRDETGALHYRGRRDRQVKIAGQRVELAEVEAVARELDEVRQCAAIAVPGPDGGTRSLALFYVSTVGTEPVTESDGRDPIGLARHLAARLPAFMVPSVVQRRNRLPVTANGKLDGAGLLELVPGPRRRPAGAGR